MAGHWKDRRTGQWDWKEGTGLGQAWAGQAFELSPCRLHDSLTLHTPPAPLCRAHLCTAPSSPASHLFPIIWFVLDSVFYTPATALPSLPIMPPPALPSAVCFVNSFCTHMPFSSSSTHTRIALTGTYLPHPYLHALCFYTQDRQTMVLWVLTTACYPQLSSTSFYLLCWLLLTTYYYSIHILPCFLLPTCL